MNSARDRWTDRYGGEWDDPAHVLVWGRRRPLEDLVAGDRFATLAARLWVPLRDAEELT